MDSDQKAKLKSGLDALEANIILLDQEIELCKKSLEQHIAIRESAFKNLIDMRTKHNLIPTVQ